MSFFPNKNVRIQGRFVRALSSEIGFDLREETLPDPLKGSLYSG